MPTLLCPTDLTAVYLHESESMVACPTCQGVLVIQVAVMRFGCDHEPRPVRGDYRWGSQIVPYQFCSGECRAEAQAGYPSGVTEVVA